VPGRRPEPRIDDPRTHPKRFVCLEVAATYLGISRRTLNALIDEGKITAKPFVHRRKIAITELVRFEESNDCST
jgi:excisionase family DNA binding protein